MAEFISASKIKDSLTECPICTEQFDETSRIPRRMPCCVQSVCQPCLETYSGGRQTLSCPMCRHQHHLPDGIKSLPKEPLVLKILDHLKIQKGLHLPCTDCPDKNNAIARCEECCVFLCQECLNAHRRVRSLRDHKIVAFEEMRSLPVESLRKLHQCKEHHHVLQFYCHTCKKVICVSCTVVEHDKGQGHIVVSIDKAHEEEARLMEDTLSKLELKETKLKGIIEDLKKKTDEIKSSTQRAKDKTNMTFDNMIEELQLRRTSLLLSIDDKSNKELGQTQEALTSMEMLLCQVASSTAYTRKMRSKADKIEDLQMITTSADSFKIMQEEKLERVQYAKIQAIFDEAQVQQLGSSVKTVGEVKTVKYQQQPYGSVKQEILPESTTLQFDVISESQFSARLNPGRKKNKRVHGDLEAQKCDIGGYLKMTLNEGDFWFLLDMKWFKQWKIFVGFDDPDKSNVGDSSTNPGPIDNSDLLDNGQLKEHLVDNLDFILLPEEGWSKLISWYGIVKGQNPIRRTVIMQGVFFKHCKVEVYLLRLKLTQYSNVNTFVERILSRADSIADIENVTRQQFNKASQKEVRLWNHYMSSTCGHLNEPNNILEDAGLHQGQVIMIEVKNEDGSWTRTSK